MLGVAVFKEHIMKIKRKYVRIEETDPRIGVQSMMDCCEAMGPIFYLTFHAYEGKIENET